MIVLHLMNMIMMPTLTGGVMMTDHDSDCFVSDDHDHDDNPHRLEDICQLGDDGGVEGGEEGHRAQEVDLVLQLLQTWSAELLGIMQNY